MNTIHYSTKTAMWDTPDWLVQDLRAEFEWDLDVCASYANVCERFYSEDSLHKKWEGLCWTNPPYGRRIGDWMEKAYHSSMMGSSVVCLVPARTDTRWWHNYARHASQIVFIRGRLVFGSRQAWVERRIEQLRKIVSWQEMKALAPKIGGRLVGDDDIKREMRGVLGEKKYNEWLNEDNVVGDSAPFPSAFVVFGQLEEKQHSLLASYGMSYDPTLLWSLASGILDLTPENVSQKKEALFKFVSSKHGNGASPRRNPMLDLSDEV